MEKLLQQENQSLKNKIIQLQQQIKSLLNKQYPSQTQNNQSSQNKQIKQDQTSHSIIEYSPIHTCQSLQQDAISLDIQHKINHDQIQQTQSNSNITKTIAQQKQTQFNKFQLQDKLDQDSNIANSQLSKQLQLQQSKFKKSIQPVSQLDHINSKNIYNSAIRQKNICQQCIIKMHQMHQIQFLKNKYHRQYITLRTQLEKVKAELNQHQYPQTPRSSINLIQFYGDHNNQQKSQKSSFSFENIQNTLLSQRFSLQIQQCIKLVDKLLPLDRKSIQFSSGDFKLLMDLQVKIERLKTHLGFETQPKYLEDLFNQLQKSQQLIKKIHQKYKKLFERIYKVHKQKIKKSKDDFNQVNQKIIIVLKDLTESKFKNQKLNTQINQLKTQLQIYQIPQQVKVPKSQNLSSSHELKPKSLKDSLSHEVSSVKQKDLNDTSLSQCQKSSSVSELKVQKQIEKYQQKLKNSQKYNKSLQKLIKQLKGQMLTMKKKSLNDFNQFMNAIIFQSHSKLRNTTQQTQNCTVSEILPDCVINENEIKIISQLSTKKLIEQIGTLVYEIFSFTSWQNDEDENIFLPQSEQQILQMLRHIKRFAQKFDSWQKQKQRQINGFQKNFLGLLKFLIDNYKISQNKLLQEISKMKDNEPLGLYIKKYYSKTVQLSDQQDRDSSSFTFGQKSQSCKDSQVQP